MQKCGRYRKQNPNCTSIYENYTDQTSPKKTGKLEDTAVTTIQIETQTEHIIKKRN